MVQEQLMVAASKQSAENSWPMQLSPFPWSLDTNIAVAHAI